MNFGVNYICFGVSFVIFESIWCLLSAANTALPSIINPFKNSLARLLSEYGD